MFDDNGDIKERNMQILKAIEKGYSQHGIAKIEYITAYCVWGVEEGVLSELSLSLYFLYC
jgi:hypothetical protein